MKKSLPAWLFNRQVSTGTSKRLPLLIFEEKRFRFELSSFNKKVCIYEFGSGKRFAIWFDLRGSLWLLDSITALISSGKPPHQFLQRNGNRTLKIHLRSNRNGRFLKVIESRQFGHTYFCIPEGKRGIGFQLFLADLQFSVHSLKGLSEDPIPGPDEGWICSVERVSMRNPMSISESLLQRDVNIGLLGIIDNPKLHFVDGISLQMEARKGDAGGKASSSDSVSDRNGWQESEIVSESSVYPLSS
ncbi:unnamed protein product [Cuscuta campestris]|uniref:Uncharacterized protein n=1 Tax=Cuscuta campestris TaxID=132261 RepID=A0A484KN53_9ASTE|nr:unnamed protein product [Cuscuta campestris]